MQERPSPATPPMAPKSERSKQARTGGASFCSVAEHFYSSSTSTTVPTSPESFPPEKKKKKIECGSPTRCTYCGVQETPQWREGPQGARSLCNACGLRYRSGRLLPENRSACSPTFSSQLHSNRHRDVLEMREKKETTMTGQPESGNFPPHPIPSSEDSGNLHHPVLSSDKYDGNAPFSTGERTTMQLTIIGDSTDDSEPNGQQEPWYFRQDDDALYLRMVFQI